MGGAQKVDKLECDNHGRILEEPDVSVDGQYHIKRSGEHMYQHATVPRRRTATVILALKTFEIVLIAQRFYSHCL